MRHLGGVIQVGVVMALGLLIVAGCEPAGRYNLKPPALSTKKERPFSGKPKETPQPEKPKPPEPPPANYVWELPDPSKMEPEVPLEFVHAGAKEWANLQQFWNWIEKPNPAQPLALIAGSSSLNVLPLAGLMQDKMIPRSAKIKVKVQIKVPLGLDDPTKNIPPANPPTVGKWELGKQLFFDKTWLPPDPTGKETSCARCHDPRTGFTSLRTVYRNAQGKLYDVNNATVINSAYNTYNFWDGRARPWKK
jgi:hypothetical protein